jgi:hypothetical protein
MTAERRRARIYRGDAPLGEVTIDPAECEPPWFVGVLEPAPGFEAVRALFERQADAVDRSFGEGPAAEAAERESMRVQAEILGPGVWAKWLDSDRTDDVTGIDVRGSRVTWR